MRSGVLHARPQAAGSRRRLSSRPITRTEAASPTRLLFIRHASHDLVNRVLVGRKPDVPISAAGIEEAHRAAARLAEMGITRVHTSPRQRAVETAGIIARVARVPMQISFALDEIDVGTWTGLSFEELAKEQSWSFWNMLRSLARPPEGESMREVQERIVPYLARLHAAYPGGRIALVSHAEVIRTAILHCDGLSLDAYAEVKVPPAEVIGLIVDAEGARMADCDEAA